MAGGAAAPFVIIGGGQAGGWIAKTLRAQGHAGPIVLIGDERHAPYERPPLSKAALLSVEAVAETRLLSHEEAENLGIALRLGDAAVAIDRDARQVRCATGEAIGYDRLFLTMGSRPRLPDWYLAHDRLHVLRTIDDAARLRSALASARSLVVVGAGWIGLEIAATARACGVAVTVVEIGDRVCARSLPAPVSHWLERLHRDNGVDFRFSAAVGRIGAHENAITATLADGTELQADQCVVGIGNVPNTGLAEAAGLAVANGIVVDAACRTSDPLIYAAGDVCAFPCDFAAGTVRRESWANAQNQAIVAARAALGQAVLYDELPWLWSDQYGINIQIAGLPERGSRALFRPGATPDCGTWLTLDARGVTGAVAIDDPRGLRPVRKALQQRLQPALEGWVEAAT